MKERIVLMLICFFGMNTCIIPKEDRMLKKDTKSWRESSVVLEAYGDSPFSGSFLKLRENGKFEHTSSGLVQSFETGNWTNNQDTIYLLFIDLEQRVRKKQMVFIDRKTSTLEFEGYDTPVPMRLRIRINKL